MPADTHDRGARPSSADPALSAGHKLFSSPVTFLLGAAALSQVPASDLPEIAFAGRSNVGKSSLINALTGDASVARTSNTPGRTQQINFFALGPEPDPRLMMADLPGYGFAKAPKEVVAKWTKMIKGYLTGRANLRRVLVLVDSRHGLKKTDEEIMALLDQAAVNYQVVLTKIDKLKKGQLEKVTASVTEGLAKRIAAHPEVLMTSSEKGTGIAELRAALTEIALP